MISNNSIKCLLPPKEDLDLIKFITKLPGGRKFLKEMNLSGEIPKDAAKIREATWKFVADVEYLNLCEEKIQNNLPPEIKKLTSLRRLSLCHNSSDFISPVVWELTQLKGLILENHSLSRLPIELTHLLGLTGLDVIHNQIETFPEELYQLSHLTHLNLDFNHITALPSEINRLTKLQELSLKENRLSHLPPEIGDLKSLLVLDLNYNELEDLPPEIGKLKSLRTFLISNNKIKNVPKEVGHLTSLDGIDFTSNNFEHFPQEFGNQEKILRLHIEYYRAISINVKPGALTRILATALKGISQNDCKLVEQKIIEIVANAPESLQRTVSNLFEELSEAIDLTQIHSVDDIYYHFANAVSNSRSIRSFRRKAGYLRLTLIYSQIVKTFTPGPPSKEESSTELVEKTPKKSKRKKRRRCSKKRTVILSPIDKATQIPLEEMKTTPPAPPKKKTLKSRIKAKVTNARKNPTVMAAAVTADVLRPRRKKSSNSKFSRAFDLLHSLRPQNVKYREFEKIAYGLGASISRKRGKGSHTLASFPGGSSFPIPAHNPVKKGMASEIIKRMKAEGEKRLALENAADRS